MAKFINYRDIDLKINSQEFYASQVSIGASASIEPVILSDGSLLNYSPTNALVGDFNCEFYLTDSLPSFLNVTGTNEDAVSINFAGVEKIGTILNSTHTTMEVILEAGFHSTSIVVFSVGASFGKFDRSSSPYEIVYDKPRLDMVVFGKDLQSATMSNTFDAQGTFKNNKKQA